jgi:hypothetical protein
MSSVSESWTEYGDNRHKSDTAKNNHDTIVEGLVMSTKAICFGEKRED